MAASFKGPILNLLLVRSCCSEQEEFLKCHESHKSTREKADRILKSIYIYLASSADSLVSDFGLLLTTTSPVAAGADGDLIGFLSFTGEGEG